MYSVIYPIQMFVVHSQNMPLYTLIYSLKGQLLEKDIVPFPFSLGSR